MERLTHVADPPADEALQPAETPSVFANAEAQSLGVHRAADGLHMMQASWNLQRGPLNPLSHAHVPLLLQQTPP